MRYPGVKQAAIPTVLAIAVLLCAATVELPVSASGNFLVGSTGISDLELSADCYPQALPNDGRSQAMISITALAEGQPAAGEVIRAEITRGDGSLEFVEAVTDEDGVAQFPMRAGMMPEPTEIRFFGGTETSATTVAVPLAPITYLDVQLVTPEEYAKHRARQASAAPIYQLRLSTFPEQLAADGGSLATVHATLIHTATGKPAPGVPLTAEIISGEGSLSFNEKMATDSNGEFSFYFVAGMTPGTASIAVIEPSTGLTVATDILLVEAGPARVELLYLDPFSGTASLEGALLPADGMTALPLTARITDLSGMPLSGVELRLEIMNDAGGWVELLDPFSDVSGEINANYYAGTVTGKVRLRAYICSGI
jgi:5-hydroxyisourate hydrolase-like protein (transthyretin family)